MELQQTRWAFLLISALTVGNPGNAKRLVANGPVQELVSRERSFAQAVERDGYRRGFLDYIADDGIMFMPGPVLGKPVLVKAADESVPLSWSPSFAGIAASGDLGFTTGPYDYANPKSPSTGQYLTIWRRQDDGSWRFVLDRGIKGPVNADMTDTTVVLLKKSAARRGTSADEAGKAAGDFAQQEAKLATASLQSAATGLKRHLAANSRLLRQGHAPASDDAARAALLARARAGVRYTVQGSSVSKAGDLAYSYGLFEPVDPSGPPNGTFVRIWQKQAGDWRIVLDSSAPMPTRAVTE